MGLLSGLMGSGGSPSADATVIKDSDTQHFMNDVIQASRDQPVIVDFWAPWCGPCKQLGPILERVVKNAGGKVRLVKINIDENPELAQQLRIQSIPMVYAFKGGQPVDGFAGALPESQIKAFVERLAGPLGPGPTEVGLEQAKQAAAAGQTEVAARIYEKLLQGEPDNPEALAGLARCQIATGRLATARETLARVPVAHTNHVEVDGARSALSLAEESGTLADVGELNSRLAADENDHSARLDLATALFLRGQVDAAIEHLLAIVRKDREWQDQAARKQLIKFFDALGPQHPATVSGRRRLSTVLFA
ncbi:MAG TPA: thioredoxin [Geminicoccaceae bacterium]|nr:thioredoxin [Geminicoccaceae bacterium]